ncbi:MAG TPA: hypothetical protein DDY58_01895 [Terrisporobacter glycolicus]|uniref:MazG nucleotide pyrophosphohydrolase domain-containing protein n=1 Tax=Terrisporobacter TaxID=1505652 RepID=UPI000E882055|nr:MULTISPECIES: MazG nucleotide pyrophosphohydrolase domain-containing protein [Terrisporobacter]HBI91278.1 hypothetical protein [Terrisporobacter hibernicus]
MFKCAIEKCEVLNEWICCSVCNKKDDCECKCNYYEFEECSDRKIKFPVLDISKISLVTEVDKLTEETHEFINAIVNNDEDNMIEEALDVFQVVINILYRYELTDKLEEGLKIHIEKLKSRGWEIEKWV